ncbi:hypothetical protein GQX73_g10110 [Xylaria multiplex]|uniref:Uncharacterized protein n=1 Tax=Xylaria multiplex TaxID=323545 RepID=A0A7C8IKN3_9PEZI|nr:hypothetical protein GQX73_g10110 [Xylaria multiplex]
MDASRLAAFTSAANTICYKSAADPRWAKVDLHMIVEALHHELSEFALPQKQALPGESVAGNLYILDKAPPAQIPDHKSSKNNNNKNQAAPTNAANPRDGQESVGSDALSDTSFTPPKNIGKCVRFDEDGRRHVILPPGAVDRTPKQRFVREDKNRQRKLLPPPGFDDLAPAHIIEVQQEPEGLTFERKRVFKNPAVKFGGISLAMMREQPQRFEKLRQMHSEKRKDASKKHKSKKHQRSQSQPLISVTTDGKTTHWQSWFLKGVFDAEEDLLYNSRWPASSF